MMKVQSESDAPWTLAQIRLDCLFYFFYHPHYLPDQPGVAFPLAATEVGYTPLNLLLTEEQLIEGGLVAFSFTWTSIITLSSSHSCYFCCFLSVFSVVHTEVP